jgi:hypothetical protein
LRNYSSYILADTFALVSFAFIVGMFVEVILSGLTFEQSIQSRLWAIPLNAIIARPYGIYRDRLLVMINAGKKGKFIRFLIDIVAFITFMVPQYIAVLYWIGANPQQIIVACVTVTTMSLVIGRPYGLYMDSCRKVLEKIKI